MPDASAGPRPAPSAGRPPAAPAFTLDESKLHAPRPRPGIVDRTALVERLTTADRRPVLSVVAPAGYGKSTLLAQCTARWHPRVAWLSADDRDNDPAVLMAHLAVALDRVEPIEPTLLDSLLSEPAGFTDVAPLASAISAMRAPVVIVLDHAEALTETTSRDIIAELAVRVPAGSQLAIGSRDEPPVPVARLRSDGRVVELDADDLAMDESEATSLLAGAGVELDDAAVHDLVECTEGWPAGLYLAALAIGAGSPHAKSEQVFTGDDRFMADYLRAEFLARLSRADVSFLTRTSILARMSGPLCDATVGRGGSGRVLDRLERRNLLVIPLDRRGVWYRYHHLFRDLLHAELVRREPDIVPDLHARAMSWYEANNLPETALDHAQQAGDADSAERLFLRVVNPAWASGRLETVLRWMEWFPANGMITDHPAVAIHGALICAMTGRPGDALRWADAAERTTATGTLPDGNTMDGSLAYLRALMCRRGLGAMCRDASTALHGLDPTSPYRAAMLHAEGAALLLGGEPDRADRSFDRAFDEATNSGLAPFLPLLMAERGIAAIDRDDWDRADELAADVVALVQDDQFDHYWTSALGLAWAARMACRRGDVAAARELVARAVKIRPLLTYALPVVSAQALLELAHAHIALADPGGAQVALRQIRDIHRHRPELGNLPERAEELRSTVDSLRGDMLGVASLTTAELRLLPLMTTHLTLSEIAERLFVSRSTVKTQASSIYRKLGVAGRGEAIERIQQIGRISGT